MTVAWYDLASFHSLIDIVLDVILGPVLSVLLRETQNEVQALLVGESVQWTGETVHTG